MEDQKLNYMMLDRLRSDCNFFLGFGDRNPKVLWAENVADHIAEMKRIYELLPTKPEWITMEEILEIEKKMIN